MRCRGLLRTGWPSTCTGTGNRKLSGTICSRNKSEQDQKGYPQKGYPQKGYPWKGQISPIWGHFMVSFRREFSEIALIMETILLWKPFWFLLSSNISEQEPPEQIFGNRNENRAISLRAPKLAGERTFHQGNRPNRNPELLEPFHAETATEAHRAGASLVRGLGWWPQALPILGAPQLRAKPWKIDGFSRHTHTQRSKTRSPQQK